MKPPPCHCMRCTNMRLTSHDDDTPATVGMLRDVLQASMVADEHIRGHVDDITTGISVGSEVLREDVDSGVGTAIAFAVVATVGVAILYAFVQDHEERIASIARSLNSLINNPNRAPLN